jgi:hypothetical protein
VTPRASGGLQADLSSELVRLERVIERGLQSFLDVGEALVRIRDGQLYHASGYPSFSRYLEGRWQMTRRRAYQLINTAEVVAASPELAELRKTLGSPALPVNHGRLAKDGALAGATQEAERTRARSVVSEALP